MIRLHHIAFDIETEPLPDEELEGLKPDFHAPKTWKDPLKIAESIAQQKADWKLDAALSAITGRIIAIGYHTVTTDGAKTFEADTILDLDEPAILGRFWNRVTLDWHVPWVGFRIHAFDLPFIVRRGWKHRIPMPPMDRLRSRGYWNQRFVDLQVEWQLGDRQAHGSLDAISKHLGTGAKNGDGAEFHKILRSNPTKALDYLRNDVVLTTEAYNTFLGPY